MMFADVHAHLDTVPNIEQVMKEAREKGVAFAVTAAVDQESAKESLRLSQEVNGIYASIGLHPSNILLMSTEQIKEGLGFVKEHLDKAVAVGEIGLDFKHADSKEKRDLQREVFAQQLEIAQTAGKPVVVHARRSQEECLRMLEEHALESVLLHWFIGNKKAVRAIEERGYFVSVGPNVVFEKGLAGYVKSLPSKALTLETDAPVAWQGAPTDPTWIPRTAESLAELRGWSLAETGRRTTESAKKLFGLGQKD